MVKNNVFIPKHIVLFPDGNRRWAKQKGLDTLQGHQAGYEKIVEFCTWCKEKGVKVITAFGFSTENWNRPKPEVSYLMNLLERYLIENFQKYKTNFQGVRLRVIGQKERLPVSLQKAIKEGEEGTKDNSDIYLNLAVSYGGRWDIVEAAKKAIEEKVSLEKLDEKVFASYLSTAGLPDPDLVIRAGGERRFSNFVLWQAAYAELYFSPKYWPDFTKQDFNNALADYASRQRRFGH